METTAITRRAYRDTALTIPLLGFGMMRLPKLSADRPDIDYDRAAQMFDTAIQAGCNYFDTAYMYHDGKSETCCGDLLSAYPRESLYLADKMPLWQAKTPDSVRRIFEEQLAKTRAGYFDFYLLHALDAGKWRTVQEIGALDYLLERKREGLIRHLGFSFHDSPEALRVIADAHDWDFAQIQLNYLDWDGPYRSREQYELLTERNIPVIVMEPVHGGALAQPDEQARRILQEAAPDASPASWALRFAASLPNVLTVLSGMSDEAQLADNLRTFSPLRPLDGGERETLALALAALQKTLAVPCTGCRYCLPCSVGVAIPEMFALYNRLKAAGDHDAFRARYQALPGDQRAEACVACGQCLERCPQHLDIPARLAEVAKAICQG